MIKVTSFGNVPDFGKKKTTLLSGNNEKRGIDLCQRCFLFQQGEIQQTCKKPYFITSSQS